MADQAQACELLKLSATNPSASMKWREVLRFDVDGRAAYPLLQFDVESRRVFPVMKRLIAMTPEGWSDFRPLNWLTQPHLEFGQAPARLFGARDDEVLAAFGRAVEPPDHG